MIVCEPTSGLTSRIYVIADAYDMAKKYRQELVIIWRKTSDCNCSYKQVFDDNQFNDIKIKIYECNQYDFRFGELSTNFSVLMVWKALREIFIRLKYACKHTILYNYYRKKCCIYKNSYKDNNELFDEGKAEGNNSFFECYNCITGKGDIQSIIFNQSFIKEADDVIGKLNGNYIGVHIRRTDHGLAKAASTTDKFIIRMKAEIEKDSDIKFYVATDDWNEQKKMQELFGERIISQPHKVLERSSWEGMHSSIIDTLCLSKSKYILGSNSSIFSKFSAEYGKIELFIV